MGSVEAASALMAALHHPQATVGFNHQHHQLQHQQQVAAAAAMAAAFQPQLYYAATNAAAASAAQGRPHTGLKRGPELLSPNASVFSSVMTIDQEAKKAKLDTGAAAVFGHLMPSMNGLSAAQFLTGTPLSQFEIAMAPTSSAIAFTSAAAQNQATIQQPQASGHTRSVNAENAAPMKPSRVVHLRNIPSDMVDVELVHFCMQYGKINNYMLLKGKNQAFVEFEEQMCSTTMCDSLAAVPIQIRGRTMFAQYSTHQELKIDTTPRKRIENTDEVVAWASEPATGPTIAGLKRASALGLGSAVCSTAASGGGSSTSSDPLQSNWGVSEATPEKNPRLLIPHAQLHASQLAVSQAQVQAAQAQAFQALMAAQVIHGEPTYATQWSTPVVHPITATLPTTTATMIPGPPQHVDTIGKTILGGSGSSQLDIATGTQQNPNSVLRVIIENMLYPVTLDVLYGIFSRFGKVLRIITFNKNNTFQALVQLSEANSAQVARQALDNQNVYNGCCTLRIDYSKLATLNVKYNNDKSRDYTNPNLPSGELTLEQQLSLVSAALPPGSVVPSFAFPFGSAAPTAFIAPQQAAALTTESLAAASSVSPFLGTLGSSTLGVNSLTPSALTAGLRFPVTLLNVTSVVLVSNLDEQKATPDALFTLFGVYGDVLRVKILFNKKDNALIQFSEPQQAQLAMQHLDKIKWHDKVIRVAASKHTTVQMPKEGQPDAGLTRDYAHSPLHRFKKPGSKNYMNIYPPSSTLHLSNIPPTITEEFLAEAFVENGFQPKAFKFFPKDHKMALLQLDDVEQAIDALIAMHNYKLAENAHLRVSFSKSGI